MANFEPRLAARCLLIGIVAGMRSMSAPAVVIEDLLARSPDLPMRPLLTLLATRPARSVALFNSVGEMVFDKLPFVPDRTNGPSVVFRCFSGAASAGVLASVRGADVGAGAAFGILGALIGTFGGFRARRWIGGHTPIPDAITAIAEDGMALLLAKKAVSG